MKITSLKIPAGYEGLQEVQMRGLESVVLLAGPNGGGKSRLLAAVGNYARAKLTQEEIGRKREEIQNHKNSIQHYQSQIDTLEAKGVDDHRNSDWRRNIKNHEEQIANVEKSLDDHACAEIDRADQKPVVVDYRVAKLEMRDSRNFSFMDLKNTAGSMASDFNLGLATEYGLGAIHNLLDRYVHVNSSVTKSDPVEKAKVVADVDRLKLLVRELLLTELDFTEHQGPILFGRPIHEARLSNGQKVLLQILVSLFFQDGTKENLVLLLDEPENHLHPQALLQLIDRIRSSCPHAQIWIATHSLNLLAHFPNERVWFVKEGAVEFAGSKSLEVLHSLVGDDEGLEELASFLALPAKSAALSFAVQCMTNPEVIDTAVGDPQTQQIHDLIRQACSQARPLRVLDIGMGTGRLLSELAAQANLRREVLADEVDYFGFDVDAAAENIDLCKSRLQELYAGGESRYISGVAELRGRLNRRSVHLAVMCNVLHEIPPQAWVEVFGANGYLADMLHPEGHLLIVEDQLLKFGERAHAFGFLVLNSTELRVLFGCLQEDSSFRTFDHPDARYRKRLRAHLIPAKFMGSVTLDSTRDAICELQGNAYREIQSLHGEQYSFSRGRQYAFWTHQYVNATLALSGQH